MGANNSDPLIETYARKWIKTAHMEFVEVSETRNLFLLRSYLSILGNHINLDILWPLYVASSTNWPLYRNILVCIFLYLIVMSHVTCDVNTIDKVYQDCYYARTHVWIYFDIYKSSTNMTGKSYWRWFLKYNIIARLYWTRERKLRNIVRYSWTASYRLAEVNSSAKAISLVHIRREYMYT